MEKRSTVGKSKSSNSAIISRIYRNDKKSSSNNEIKPPIIKKRGVYVEKKLKPGTDRVPQKPPKRPRPEQKKFLASVLNILSKTTAGTQYPEKDNSDKLTPRSRKKTETKKKSRKPKYKSRVLNNELKEDEEIIILKSKKNRISQSPSMFSQRSIDGLKWTEVSQNEAKKNSVELVLESNISQGLTEDAAKDVLKAPKSKKKLRIQDEPTSEINTDKKIYNFFVDLLETTFNIYNVEGTDCETTDSKTRLEVDESVAQKLVIKNESLLNDQTSYYTNEIDTDKNLFLNSYMNKPLDVKMSEHKLPKTRPKITKSYPYSIKQNPIKSNNVDVLKKTFNRKPKQKLLDILKEQLTRDVFTFEEPQNLYQSLKIMAKNKRKYKKTIHYEYENNKFEGFDKKECTFRRKALFQSKKKSRKPDRTIPKLGSRSFEIKSNKHFSSYHSLEVYGYDYEEPVKRHLSKPVEKKHNIWLEIHSPSSISESDLYCSTVEFGEVAV